MLLDLYLAHPFWVWAAVAAALLAVEVATSTGWLLWPSAAAFAVGLLELVFELTIPGALLVFAVLTIASTLLARRFLPRSATETGQDINDNIGRLVGHQGRAVAAFAGGEGRVAIDGKEWAAELDDGAVLEAGAEVEVTGVSGGSRLRVRPSR